MNTTHELQSPGVGAGWVPQPSQEIVLAPSVSPPSEHAPTGEASLLLAPHAGAVALSGQPEGTDTSQTLLGSGGLSSSDVPLNPPGAEHGGPGDLPPPPPDVRSHEAPEPEPPHGIGRWVEVRPPATTEEQMMVAARYSTATHGALMRHGDDLDVLNSGKRQVARLVLQSRDDVAGWEADIQIDPQGLEITLHDTQGSEPQKEDGAVSADAQAAPQSTTVAYAVVPRLGILRTTEPTPERTEHRVASVEDGQEIRRIEEKGINRELAFEEGRGVRVGAAEMAFVSQVLANAEPPTITMNDLQALQQTRREANIDVYDPEQLPDTARGYLEFNELIRDLKADAFRGVASGDEEIGMYLKREEQEPDGTNVTITIQDHVVEFTRHVPLTPDIVRRLEADRIKVPQNPDDVRVEHTIKYSGFHGWLDVTQNVFVRMRHIEWEGYGYPITARFGDAIDMRRLRQLQVLRNLRRTLAQRSESED